MKVSDISVHLVDVMGSDLSVVNAARVSFLKESGWDFNDNNDPVLFESDDRLIKYLAKHRHYSPFNHTFLTFRIKAPIFVARQLVKHEYMPWNEVSRRYVDTGVEFYMPEVWRAKAENVKQGSSDVAVTEIKLFDAGTGEWWTSDLEAAVWNHAEAAFSLYEAMTKAGVCPEQARMVLPHNLMTEWIWSGTLKAFHKMLSLRLAPYTQVETRIVAERILPIIEQHFPISIKSLLENP